MSWFIGLVGTAAIAWPMEWWLGLEPFSLKGFAVAFLAACAVGNFRKIWEEA